MYSPKIDKALIPDIYRIAKARKTPMTKLVNQWLRYCLSVYYTAWGPSENHLIDKELELEPPEPIDHQTVRR